MELRKASDDVDPHYAHFAMAFDFLNRDPLLETQLAFPPSQRFAAVGQPRQNEGGGVQDWLF
jgi:hypothetical protein